jgi:hypothetical protein
MKWATQALSKARELQVKTRPRLVEVRIHGGTPADMSFLPAMAQEDAGGQ